MPQPIRHPEMGARLDAVRKNKGYSIRHVSQSIDIDYGHINRVFHGQSLPSREILVKICKVLGCSEQEAKEIFAQTDYRSPEADELAQDELDEESVAA